MNLIIRPLAPKDIDRIVQIEQACYAVPWTAEIFGDCLKVGYPAWVLLKGDVIIGYVIMMTVLNEAHLLNICIDKSFQGQGLGEYFLKAILSDLYKKQINLIFLEVRESNQTAIMLYQKLGFIQTGLRKRYYPTASGREDALLFTLVIE